MTILKDPYYVDGNGDTVLLLAGHRRIIARPRAGLTMPALIITGPVNVDQTALNAYRSYWLNEYDNDADYIDRHIADLFGSRMTFSLGNGGWVREEYLAPTYDHLKPEVSGNSVLAHTQNAVRASLYDLAAFFESRLEHKEPPSGLYADWRLTVASVENAIEEFKSYASADGQISSKYMFFSLPNLDFGVGDLDALEHGVLHPGWTEIRFDTGHRFAVALRDDMFAMTERMIADGETTEANELSGSLGMVSVKSEGGNNLRWSGRTWCAGASSIGPGTPGFFINTHKADGEAYTNHFKFYSTSVSPTLTRNQATLDSLSVSFDMIERLAAKTGQTKSVWMANSLEERALSWIYNDSADNFLSRASSLWSHGGVLYAAGPTKSLSRFLMGTKILNSVEGTEVLEIEYELDGYFKYSIDADVINQYVVDTIAKNPTVDFGTFPDEMANMAGKRMFFTRCSTPKVISKDPAKRTKTYKDIIPYVADAYTQVVGQDDEGVDVTMRYLDRRANKMVDRYPSQAYVGFMDIDEANDPFDLRPTTVFGILASDYATKVASYTPGTPIVVGGYSVDEAEMALDASKEYDGTEQVVFLATSEGWSSSIARVISMNQAIIYLANGSDLLWNEDPATSVLVSFDSASTNAQNAFLADTSMTYTQCLENRTLVNGYGLNDHSLNPRAHMDNFGYPKWFGDDAEVNAARAIAFYMNEQLPKLYSMAIQSWL